MATKPMKVGLVGCGVISGIYIETAQRMEDIEIAACADVWAEAAQARATQYGIPRIISLEEMLADPEIEIILNLTQPQAHVEVALQALEAGKHVYGEKPFATTREEGRKVLDLAKKKGLRVGCAPDTFLGGSLQTCRKLIDDGAIGEPVAAVAFMMHHGVETRRPPAVESPTRRRVAPKDPAWYYQPGVGPMLDMGPYYLTSLATMIGPVRRATGSARITFPERKRPDGTTFKVNTPTYIAGVLDHANGAVSTIITTTDVWTTPLPRIEIYGTEGSLSVPDPNNFSGEVKIRKANETEWTDLPLTHSYAMNSRGIGLADMARAIKTGRPHRANGDLAFHILDVMLAIHEASAEGKHVEVTSDFARPAAFPAGVVEGTLGD